jgi:beta-phosphoglucomutase-like phosphatase (HAD superfamily)
MSTAPRRVLIRDFDGVLADTEPIQFDCWNQAFDELLGISIEGSYTQLVGLSLDAIFRLWRSASAGTDGLTDAVKQQVLARKNALYLEQAGQLQPMPGSLDLIRRAHEQGWYVAIASRSQRWINSCLFIYP